MPSSWTRDETAGAGFAGRYPALAEGDLLMDGGFAGLGARDASMFRRQAIGTAARSLKIVMDVAAALVMIILLCPLLTVIAALVALDGGPVVYRHTRMGSGGTRFRCLKFRSMVVDSDAALARLLESDPIAALEWDTMQKLRDDPRVTRVGRYLRSTSLDELPQLFNVLRLEMSLVGPRPIVPGEVRRYGPRVRHYYRTRPGLTGLWQVSGRADTTFQQRVQLDMAYVQTWSLWHDILILAKTVPAVLSRTGAR